MNQIANYTVHSRLTWQYVGYRVKTTQKSTKNRMLQWQNEQVTFFRL